ncbi:hypothetical protein WA026_017871 [Henosepilachna vigintioctopunctata]|uniref:Uncharacterized protein n=1 Tax=Henosepilachna vigintioctopunctata TaxID=420089 RepID=A0AAW1TLS2_9CUCU
MHEKRMNMSPETDNNMVTMNPIVINASKNEIFKVYDNWKILHRKLKSYGKVVINKDVITSQTLVDCGILVLPASQTPFEDSELNALNTYINRGGRILIVLLESNSNDESNIHVLLEEFGIIVNADALIRTHYYKYSHPKEVFISDGRVNQSLNIEKKHLNLIYPYGCTINVSKPASVLFYSGSASFPVDRPLGAVYCNQNTGAKIIALGSGHMFSDKYIDHEDNDKFREIIFNYLMSTEQTQMLYSEHDDLENIEYNIVSNTAELADKPKLCLTDAMSHATALDYTQLLEYKMHSINTYLVPDILKMYGDLNVKHQSLKIITPKFESPYPALQAAVFPPAFRDLPLPPLELFDLDEAFSSIFSKLAQFTNKFIAKLSNSNEVTNDNISFFVSECSKIIKIDEDVVDPKDILHVIGTRIAMFKSIDSID